MKIQTAIIFLIVALAMTTSVFAQSSAFSYQGKLNDGGATATGSFQFQFKLFDAPTGGTQVGATISDVAATVTNGVFSVNPDFGAAGFSAGAGYREFDW